MASLLAGCAHYAKQADKAAYATVAGGQKAALGQTKPFDVGYRPLVPSTQPNFIQVGQKVIVLGGEKPQTITLKECLEVAFRNSRSFQTRREALFISALAVANGRRGWNYPKLEGDLTGDFNDTFIAKNAGQPTKTGTAGLNPSLAQQLADGGKIGLAATLNLATDFLGSKSTAVGSLVEANFTQPLLRGAWRGFAYETQYRLERDFVFAVFDFERFRQTFATDIATQYYSVLRQRDQLENEATNIRRLKETFALTRVLVEGGQVSRIQQDQAEQDLLNAQVRYEQDRQGYQDLLDRFKLTLGLPLRAAVEVDYPAELSTLSQAGPKPVALEEAQAIEVALSVRPDVLTERAKVRDADRDVEIAANDFLPQLDVALGISAPGTGPQKFQRIQFHRNTRTLDATFDYPLDQTDNRDAYRRAIINLAQARRGLEEFLDQVRLDVRQSYRTLMQSRHSYELQLRSVQIAKRRSKLAALQQKEGQASARDVLEAEEALRSAQNGLTGALVSYTTTRLAFLAALGMLDVDEKGDIHERTEPFKFDRLEQRYPYAGAR